MDPLAGIISTVVIATWSYALIRDTGAICSTRVPDRRLADRMRNTVLAEATASPICMSGGLAQVISVRSWASQPRGTGTPPSTGIG